MERRLRVAQSVVSADPRSVEVPWTPCIAAVDEFDWHDELVAVRAGPRYFGVRTNSSALSELLAALYADVAIDADSTVDRNFSLWLEPTNTSGIRDLHRVYRGFIRAIRTRSVRRAMDTLWHELDVQEVRLSHERALFDVMAFIRDGRAHLFPGNLRRFVVDEQRRWEREGFRLVERPWLEVDLESGDVVVPAVAYSLPQEQVERRLAAMELDDRDEGTPLIGRFPVATWTTGQGDQTLASRVGQAGFQLVDRDQRLSADRLRGLAGLLGDVPPIGGDWRDLGQLRAAMQATATR